MSSRFCLPTFGSNNPGGIVDAGENNSSLLVPSIDCGSEIVYRSVNPSSSITTPIRIKLQTSSSGHHHRVKDIRLVHLYSSSPECLYIVSGEGKLYELDISNNNSLKRVLIGSTASDDDQLEVLQISSYTEAVLFLVRDKVSLEHFIYGKGSNGYFRMTHERSNDYMCSKPEIMFEPRREMAPIGEPYVINHIGCCYSFSCCIINDTLLHFTGQNWLSGHQVTTHVDGYFMWPTLIQDVKKPVIKLECGDFHSVLLHKDGTVSVGGSNSSNQLTNLNGSTPTGGPFFNILTNICNIYSGSNTVLYQSKKHSKMATNKKRFQFHGAKLSYFEFVQAKNNKEMKGLKSHESDTILDQQFARDFLMHRYEERPDVIYLDGSSYYGSDSFKNTELSLKTYMPFEEFNKGFYPKNRENDFYREMVKVILQPRGIVFICNYGSGLSSKMFGQLIKATDYSCENNRLLLDVLIHAEH